MSRADPLVGKRAQEFRTWLRWQCHRSDAVGGIARVVRDCTQFAQGSDVDLYESWWYHVLKHHSPEGLEALRTAVTEWAREDPGLGGPLPEPPTPWYLKNEPRNFSQWLLRQVGREDPIGDLARDAQEDECLPKLGSYATWRAHLLSHHDPLPVVLATLRLAWKEWSGEDPEAKLPREARWVRQFFGERTVRDSGTVPALEVYRAFVDWCEYARIPWNGGPHDFYALAKRAGEIRRPPVAERHPDEVWAGLALSPR